MRFVLALLVAAALAAGCSSEDTGEANKHHGEHKAPHGGVLNAIEKCAVGHVEALLEGNKLTLYFVGGHDKTGISLPVKAAKVELSVRLADGSEKSLALQPSPLKLAGEDIGRCSRFEAEADFLEGIKSFHASGKVEVNGVMREITVMYPEGFHPGHVGHENGHDEGEQ